MRHRKRARGRWLAVEGGDDRMVRVTRRVSRLCLVLALNIGRDRQRRVKVWNAEGEMLHEQGVTNQHHGSLRVPPCRCLTSDPASFVKHAQSEIGHVSLVENDFEFNIQAASRIKKSI